MSSKTSTKRTAPVKRTPKAKAKVWPGRKNVGKGGEVKVHGVTTTGYQRGCRCDLCKAAMAEYEKAARARRAAAKEAAAKAAKPKRTAKAKA